MLERTESSRSDAVIVTPVSDPVLSVVIVTYGTGAIVVEALAALVAHSPAALEVIVVDNPPDDPNAATRYLLRERTRGVVLVTPANNLGFGGGNDAGVALARADHVALVNPDVIVQPGWATGLIAALDDPVVAIAAPVLRYGDGRLQEAGQVIYDTGYTAAIGGPEIFTGDEHQVFDRDVDYASAACWMLRRAEYLAADGFDARYHPAYFEDADYALRVEAAGQRTRLVASVSVVHHHGQGGAGAGENPIAQDSYLVFVDRWAERLAAHRPRPADDLEAIANRDRLAHERIGHVVDTDDATKRDRIVAAALEAAASAPRDRISLFIADARPLDTDGARRAGLEIVIGDPHQTTAARAPYITRWAVGVSAWQRRRLTRRRTRRLRR